MKQYAQSLISWWNAYWFPETSSFPVAICRVVVIGANLLFFFPSLDFLLDMIRRHDGFQDPQLPIRCLAALLNEENVRSLEIVTVIHRVTVVAGLLALVGLFTRSSCAVYALGYGFMEAHRYSYGAVHHAEALMAIFLFLLPFSESGRSLSIDGWIARRRREGAEGGLVRTRFAMWPLLTTQWLFAIAK